MRRLRGRGPALLDRVPDWGRLLAGGTAEEEVARIRKHSRTGRPLGTKRFVERLERRLGRPLSPHKPGPQAQQEEQTGR